MRTAQAETEEVILGSHLLRLYTAPKCSFGALSYSPVLPPYSLILLPYSLDAPSKATLLSFPSRNDNPQS